MSAGGAYKTRRTKRPGLFSPAARTSKSFRPAQPKQIISTSLLVVETRLELFDISRIIVVHGSNLAVDTTSCGYLRQVNTPFCNNSHGDHLWVGKLVYTAQLWRSQPTLSTTIVGSARLAAISPGTPARNPLWF